MVAIPEPACFDLLRRLGGGKHDNSYGQDLVWNYDQQEEQVLSSQNSSTSFYVGFPPLGPSHCFSATLAMALSFHPVGCQANSMLKPNSTVVLAVAGTRRNTLQVHNFSPARRLSR
ncbi:hypothetical protein VTN77DRAFT_9033 [Rasamsonia byssochlamydoides]|uniref:uncharacterized protein n=1 Tax=Rasamsonia byssochlamydoides TaxID=89139 RepID=UPI00374268B1